MDDLSSHFKIHAQNIKIDPSLGVLNQGTIDVQPPPLASDTGEPHMPATIPMGRPVPKKPFLVRKPGRTLAEQLGTEETSEAPGPTPNRIRPERNVSAEQMQSMLTPRVQPPSEESLALVARSEPVKVDAPKPSSQLFVAEPPVIEPVTPVNLKDLVLKFIAKKGPEEAATFFGKSVTLMHNWASGKNEPTLAAVQMLLDKSPKARQQYLQVAEKVEINWETGEGSFQREYTKEEFPADVVLAVKGDIPPPVHWALVTAIAKYGIGEKMMTDTIIPRSRNMLADMFLKGKAQWSIWIDADIIPTIGDAPWWKAIVRDSSVSEKTMSYDFIKRFLSHNKPFVGAVYSTRRRDGPLVTQTDLHPEGRADREISEKIRKNVATGLYEAKWLSIGFACVHRVVFETIRQQHPELEPGERGGPFPFFTPEGNEGEDVALSKLARDCGFKLYLDTEMFAAHLGRWAYTPSLSQFNGILDFNNA